MQHSKLNLNSNRRTFCRHVALGMAAAMISGKPWSRLVVADLLAEEDAGGVFLLNLADYPPLANVNGSVVFSLPGAPARLAEIVVTRAANDVFYAVDSTCAHNQCTVPPSVFNPASMQNEITCSCHGSQYRADGELLEGPAERGL